MDLMNPGKGICSMIEDWDIILYDVLGDVTVLL